MKKKVFATIECRMGASRLPGKMALELYPGLPALGALIERLGSCRTIDGIIVATTDNKRDDVLCAIAKDYKAACFRGSEDDVLNRVVCAGKACGADTLVLVTGDCSCISPGLIDEGVRFFLANSYDLVSNCLIDTYPVGIDLQVVDFSALEKSHRMACGIPYCRDSNNFEHTSYFMASHPDIFSIYRYPAPKEYDRPDIQLALDTESDLKVIRNIYSRLYRKREVFDIDQILALLKEDPEILKPLDGIKVNRAGIK